MQKEKKMHSRKLHRTIVENYLCCIEMFAALAPSFRIHMHAVRLARPRLETDVSDNLWTCARMQKGSFSTG